MSELIERLCGDELNGGFVRDLCFTVWQFCQNPTHPDGFADWSTDTLPAVQAGVARIRAELKSATKPGSRVSKPEGLKMDQLTEIANSVVTVVPGISLDTSKEALAVHIRHACHNVGAPGSEGVYSLPRARDGR